MMRTSLKLVSKFGRLVAILGSLMVALTSAFGAVYHVSSSTGADDAAGTSPETAWKTIARCSETKFAPGDTILLKVGDTFEGSLTLEGSGDALTEVTLGSYGEGARPRIEGKGEEACIRLINPSQVTVTGLELTNPDGHFGLRMTGRNAGALSTVTLERLKIHDVHKAAWSQPEDPGHGREKYYGGINAEILRGERPSWWEGIIIRHCEIHDLGPCGISIGSAYPLHERMRARRGRDPFPIKGVLIEKNVIRDITRDGAIIRQCQGAVMRHNEVIRTGRVSISNGIWFWDCQDSVICYNVGTECGVQGRVDGGPFSIDYYCKDCVIEYNYSHDNGGPGFMAFGNHGTGTGTLIRGNISFNDATAELKPGFAAVSMISTLRETLVEGNIIIAGPDTRVLMGHHDWQGMPEGVTYRGNLFIGNGDAEVEPSVLVGGRFEGNHFANVPNLPEGVADLSQDAPWGIIEAMQKRQNEVILEAGVDGNSKEGE